MSEEVKATIPNPEKGQYWVNFKNKLRYCVFGIGSDATNERAGVPVVIYYGKDRALCVREVEEFKQKFYKEI